MDVSTADAWKRSVLMLNQAKLEIALNPMSVTQPQPAGQKLILLKFPAADIDVFWTQPLSLVLVDGVGAGCGGSWQGAVGLHSVAVLCLFCLQRVSRALLPPSLCCMAVGVVLCPLLSPGTVCVPRALGRLAASEGLQKSPGALSIIL